MRTTSALIACGAAALLAFSLGAAPAAAQPAPDPKIEAAQRVFEVLPEDERRAIQADLIWTGHYNGTVTGGFGPLTYRAINAFTGKSGPAADGLLAPAQRAALKDGAARARAAAGFEVLTDPRSGIRIGVPTRVLTKRATNALGGTRWQSADEKVTLDTRTGQPGETLETLFERASAASADRKVTYKLQRPDFYVVSGETRTGKFYARMAQGPEGLRGFSVGYDKAMADRVDRLVIAIAAAFEPFPGAAAPAVPATPQAGAPPAAPTPAGARALGGVIVAPGRAVTSRAALEACTGASVGGRPVAVLPGTGPLATIEAAGGAPAPMRADAVPDGEALVVLAPGPDGLVAIPARAVTANGRLALAAPLQPGAGGSPAFDRAGRLALVVSADPGRSFMVAGIVPERNHAAERVEANGGQAGAGPAGAGAGDLTTGAIVEARRGSVLRIDCRP